jgi:DNA mismatch repair protein MutS
MGHRVAICEQTEDPKLARGIVRREVVETVTPGVTYADELLDGTRNNFICSLWASARGRDGLTTQIGVAAADVSTGELRLSVTSAAALDAVLARYAPR